MTGTTPPGEGQEPPTTDTASFEETLHSVERMIKEMEDGRLPLHEVVTRVRGSRRMLENCKRMLAEVEQQIKVMEDDSPRQRR